MQVNCERLAPFLANVPGLGEAGYKRINGRAAPKATLPVLI